MLNPKKKKLTIQEENDLKEKKSIRKQNTNESINNDDSQDKLQSIHNILEDKLSKIMTEELNADDIIDDDIIDMSENSSKANINQEFNTDE